MTAQTINFVSTMGVWTAPISTRLKLIGIGTAKATVDEMKIIAWAYSSTTTGGQLKRIFKEKTGSSNLMPLS